MKRIAALVAMMSILAATSAFSATIGAADGTTAAGKSLAGDGKAIGKLSANVALSAAYDASGYAICTQNTKGTKTFGTSFDSTAIYSKEAPLADVSLSNSGAFATGWTAM